jgi:uncharacterized protein (TIGR02271 family)
MADKKRTSAPRRSAKQETVEEVAAIPLVEERLSVAKRQVESGRVRVHVSVEEHEQIVTEQLLHDELQIERIPRNIRLTEVPHVRLEGNTTIVPVVEEVVVVEKALVLVEEIHICRRSVPEETRIPVSLRSEQARIERDPVRESAAAAE